MLPVRSMKTPLLRPVQGSAAAVCNFVPGRCNLLFLGALLALFLFSPAARQQSAFGATPASASRASAAGITGANAQLNGARLIPGATLLRGDVITLGQDSSAALEFGKNDLVLAAPGTELVVEPGGISLRKGKVQIRLAGADTFAVAGPFFRVNVAASGGASGSAEILVGGKQAQVSAVAGEADVLTGGSETPYRLYAGKRATIEAARRG